MSRFFAKNTWLMSCLFKRLVYYVEDWRISSWPGRRFSRKLSSSIYIDNTIRKLMPLLQQLHTVQENNTGICNESPIKMRLSMHHVAIIIGYGNSVEIMCHHEKVHFADLHLPKNSENAFSLFSMTKRCINYNFSVFQTYCSWLFHNLVMKISFQSSLFWWALSKIYRLDVQLIVASPGLVKGVGFIISVYCLLCNLVCLQQQIFCSEILYGHLLSTSMTNPSFKILSCEEVVERAAL